MNRQEMREAFLHPSDEFSPMPFWFWNDRLDEAEIDRQIRDFDAKGVKGFCIHPRKGIPKSIPYLSDIYMHYVKYAVECAEALSMKVVLYDEAMYPSGSAHGMVVQSDPMLASRCLRMEEIGWSGGRPVFPVAGKGEKVIAAVAVRTREDADAAAIRTRDDAEEARLPYDAFALPLLEDGSGFAPEAETVLASLFPTSGAEDAAPDGGWHVYCFVEGFSGGTIRGVHEEEDDGEPCAPPSADLLNPAAVDAFIRFTHERYYEVLHEHFGKTVIAIFTDEPDVLGRNHRPGVVPWTDGFLDDYIQSGGWEADLPGLWLDYGERTAAVRRTFRRAVNRRMERVYYGKLSDWCADHGIALTGHPQKSQDIGMLNRFQIPGQDLVWRMVAPENEKGLLGEDAPLAKCASDAARHRGIRRNANECFGCCGPDGVQWALSMDDMKWYMDWMFVRGTNLLYPHAFYYSVEGEIRYGERPPDAGPNNIWWEDYEKISRYMKRLCWLNTDSHNVTPVAVLCEADALPVRTTALLYQKQIEFNYLEEELLLSGRCLVSDGEISIEKQRYHYLLVEDEALLTGELLEKLAPFVTGGGRILLTEEKEGMSARGAALSGEKKSGAVLLHEKEHGASFLHEMERDAVLTPENSDLRVSHLVKDAVHFYLLVNEGEQEISGSLRLPVTGAAERWDPWTGAIRPLPCSCAADYMTVELSLQRRESAVLCVDPAEEPVDLQVRQRTSADGEILLAPDSVSLDGKPVEMPRLCSWTELPGRKDFTGRGTYRMKFRMPESYGAGAASCRLLLDLGRVCEIAHVWMNGTDCGVLFWAPYRLDVTDSVRPGDNEVLVEVRNTMANRLEHAERPSGLLGPVRLMGLPEPGVR